MLVGRKFPDAYLMPLRMPHRFFSHRFPIDQEENLFRRVVFSMECVTCRTKAVARNWSRRPEKRADNRWRCDSSRMSIDNPWESSIGSTSMTGREPPPDQFRQVEPGSDDRHWSCCWKRNRCQSQSIDTVLVTVSTREGRRFLWAFAELPSVLKRREDHGSEVDHHLQLMAASSVSNWITAFIRSTASVELKPRVRRISDPICRYLSRIWRKKNSETITGRVDRLRADVWHSIEDWQSNWCNNLGSRVPDAADRS